MIIANNLTLREISQDKINSELQIVSYEGWGPIPVNSYLPIDEVIDRKESLILKYKTAMKIVDYVDKTKKRNFYHAAIIEKKEGFSEVFFKMGLDNYLALARKVFNQECFPDLSSTIN